MVTIDNDYTHEFSPTFQVSHFRQPTTEADTNFVSHSTYFPLTTYMVLFLLQKVLFFVACAPFAYTEKH